MTATCKSCIHLIDIHRDTLLDARYVALTKSIHEYEESHEGMCSCRITKRTKRCISIHTSCTTSDNIHASKCMQEAQNRVTFSIRTRQFHIFISPTGNKKGEKREKNKTKKSAVIPILDISPRISANPNMHEISGAKRGS